MLIQKVSNLYKHFFFYYQLETKKVKEGFYIMLIFGCIFADISKHKSQYSCCYFSNIVQVMGSEIRTESDKTEYSYL